MIGLALLAASAAADPPKVQRQLDFIVSMCRADDVVRFVTQDGSAVVMEMVAPGKLPTVKENAALQCALARVKARPDLHLVATAAGEKK